jgi:hypothetical protein
MSTRPVVFIHGLWIHSTAWEPWVALYRDAGSSLWPPGGQVMASRSTPHGATRHPSPATDWPISLRTTPRSSST